MSLSCCKPVVSEKVRAIMDTPPTLNDVMGDGTSFIDEGVHACVYAVDEQWVIRASMTQRDGFRAITKLSDRTRERLSLPRVLFTWMEQKPPVPDWISTLSKQEIIDEYGIYDLKHFDGNTIEFALVERLGKLDLGKDYIVLSLRARRQHTPLAYPGFPEGLCPTSPCYDVAKQAIRAHKALRRMGLLTGKRIDLNHTNIMKRKNGEYVLSDPFGAQWHFRKGGTPCQEY